MHKFFKNKKKLNDGFTLVETLVALSIFTTSILALMAVLARGVSDTNYVTRKTVAAYLAQEGIEYMRNMRDTFVLHSGTSQAGWNAFNAKIAPSPATLCASANGCFFSDLVASSFSDASLPITDLVPTACSSFTCSGNPLLYDSLTGKYNYTSGSNSGFSRKITINQVNLNEVRIFSTVFWTQGSGSSSIIFSENLYNWVE